MAARLTDKQKQKIVADYVQLGSYNATAKLHGVSLNTVKKVVQENAEIAQKCNQKKEQNTADILEYMESQRNDVCDFLGMAMEQLRNPEKLEKAKLQQIATTMAIVIDKYTGRSKDLKDQIEEVKIVDDFFE
ncbi:MAG: helix-turn-helix domain-containing protein [Oscillospiraceae bacterium]|nr:helix-turn-helix domain-containing protein [Oscillospiraceae bacterium]